MRRAVLGFVTLGLLTVVGCSGVKFHDSALNAVLPDTFKYRSTWQDPSILKYHLEGLAGYVIEQTGSSPYERDIQVLPSNFTLQVEAVTDGEVYSSKVDRSIAFDGKAQVPVVSAAASLKDDETMEISVTDTAIEYVPDAQIPWDELCKQAKAPNPDNANRRWVQSVMLTVIFRRTYSKVDTNANVTGAAFAANGKVFNEQGGTQKDAMLTMLLIDLNKLKDKPRCTGEKTIANFDLGALRSRESLKLGEKTSKALKAE